HVARRTRRSRRENLVLCGLRGFCVDCRSTFGIIRGMNTIAALAAVALAAQAAPSPKTDVVSVIGCLKEAAPNTWTLVSATDPIASNANAPQPKEIPTVPPAGKNEFRLIGVSEFNLPAHKDHTVIVKGLFI